MTSPEDAGVINPPDFPNRADAIRGITAWCAVVGSMRVKGAAGYALFGAGVLIGRPFAQKMLEFDGECERYEAAGGSFQDILDGTAEPITIIQGSADPEQLVT